jgi:hypothetical protein
MLPFEFGIAVIPASLTLDWLLAKPYSLDVKLCPTWLC